MNEDIFQKVDTYISDLLAREDKALMDALRAMQKAGMPPISVSANQGKLLQVLMLSCGAQRVLELGTLGGYSAIWMARALPENGQLLTLEMDEQYATVAAANIENAGLSQKVEIQVGKAIDILPQLVAQSVAPFDFIFIDADKPPYATYFDYATQLSRPGTIIVCDNVIREGKVLDPDSRDEKVKGVQLLNESLRTNKNVTATILQTVGAKEHDGMVIAVVNKKGNHH